MVEGAALEKRYAGNRIVGSNPTLSAIIIRGNYEILQNVSKLRDADEKGSSRWRNKCRWNKNGDVL